MSHCNLHLHMVRFFCCREAAKTSGNNTERSGVLPLFIGDRSSFPFSLVQVDVCVRVVFHSADTALACDIGSQLGPIGPSRPAGLSCVRKGLY
jgi:hypothetical protein